MRAAALLGRVHEVSCPPSCLVGWRHRCTHVSLGALRFEWHPAPLRFRPLPFGVLSDVRGRPPATPSGVSRLLWGVMTSFSCCAVSVFACWGAGGLGVFLTIFSVSCFILCFAPRLWRFTLWLPLRACERPRGRRRPAPPSLSTATGPLVLRFVSTCSAQSPCRVLPRLFTVTCHCLKQVATSCSPGPPLVLPRVLSAFTLLVSSCG